MQTAQAVFAQFQRRIHSLLVRGRRFTRIPYEALSFTETMMIRRFIRAAGLMGVLVAGPAAAQVRLPRLFQDGMVLQRDAPVEVWGWAAPGSAVAATLNGRTERATAGPDSAWSVRFPRMGAGGPHTLAVEGSGARAEIRDVWVGDVWVASGQSNMQWKLANASNGAATVAAARDPMIREFAVPHSWSEAPEKDLAGGSWERADPSHAGDFSAVAYFFARDLRAFTGVPIGIIHTTWGGSAIETWLSRESLGLSDGAARAAVARERAADQAVRDTLRRRLGELPTRDEGLVGGRAVWADPALDDSRWSTLPVPAYWERAGLPGLSGVAWYRTTFTLTADEARRGGRISLGGIDDNDITWVNGTEVGRTSGKAVQRVYTLPAVALRAGRNVVAVRVTDSSGEGGLYGGELFVEAGGARHSLAGAWRFRVGQVPAEMDAQVINKIPTVLYNRMIHPLLRFPVRGVLWYQGESNAGNVQKAAAYRPLFDSLIRGWRGEWSGAARDFPFLWVQLPNYGRVDTVPPARAPWATLRESQSAALSLPNTGQVVATDLGEPGNLHPTNKEPVGVRLARVARRVAYGDTVAASGPTYLRHTVSAGRVTVELRDGGGGLVPARGIRGFAVAGADRRWHWAEARVEGERVVVWSPSVPTPVAVRYNWSNSPAGPGLYNRAGLPAAPFRSDDW